MKRASMDGEREAGGPHLGLDSSDALVDIWDFVGRCERRSSVDDLAVDYSALIAKFGFRHAIMARMPASEENTSDRVLFNAWPRGWTDRYQQMRYFLDDQVTLWSLRAASPFRWRDARMANLESTCARTIRAEAAEFGLADGIALPLLDSNCRQAVASLASDRPVHLDSRIISLIHLATISCHQRCCDLLAGGVHSKEPLSDREREILTWVAVGKSA